MALGPNLEDIINFRRAEVEHQIDTLIVGQYREDKQRLSLTITIPKDDVTYFEQRYVIKGWTTATYIKDLFDMFVLTK